MKILLVVDHSNRFLQNKHRFDTLDVNYMKEELAKEHEVKEITYYELVNNLNDYKGYNIIYTGSQMEQYKNFIENIMYFAKDDNVIIPKFEILKSHENKFFQELYNRKLGIKTNIEAKLFGDIKEYIHYNDNNEVKYPLVIKGINGSASMNVKIAKSYEQSLGQIKEINSHMVEGMNIDMPAKYDLFPEENIENRQFVVQEFINLPNYDYRVHIMGDKYWGHKRTLLENSEYTSGDGSVNDYACELPKEVLNYAQDIFNKLDVPHVILDIVHNEEQLYLIEWSALHLGCASLIGAQRYYKLEDENWNKYNEEKPKLEDEYVYAWNWYLNNIILGV